MHRHGVDRFDIVKPTRQYKAYAALPVVTGKRHTQYMAWRRPLTLGKLEGDANIAIHQAKTVIVACHQHRAAFIPLLVAFNQLAGEQRSGNTLVQPLNAPRPFSHSAKHLKRLKSL